MILAIILTARILAEVTERKLLVNNMLSCSKIW